MASPRTQWELWTDGARDILGTGSGSVPDVLDQGPTPTQTSAKTASDAAIKTDWSGMFRNIANIVNDVATETHQTDYMLQVRLRTSELVGAGGQTLLGALADMGFAWRDIARMVGVSVPAIQKWRRGEGLTGENARKLARLVAACEVIQKFNPMVTDVALWFEAPIVDEAPVTPIDLWATGNQQLVFEHARLEVDPLTTMDSFDPNWRETYRSEFETFRAGDGDLSIRMRER